MKLHHFILAGFLGLVFSSCNLLGESESTPQFDFRAMRIVDGDTTFVNFNHAPFDTISVGDIIHFQTWMFSEFNNLQEFRITPSRTGSVEFVWRPRNELDSVFTSASDYDRGIFVMPGTSPMLTFPFQYVALEAYADLMLTFSVRNTGSQGYNTTARTIRTPIKKAETE